MSCETESLRAQERALAERIRLLQVERRAVLRLLRRSIRAQRRHRAAAEIVSPRP